MFAAPEGYRRLWTKSLCDYVGAAWRSMKAPRSCRYMGPIVKSEEPA
jgi:hypothetical protein